MSSGGDARRIGGGVARCLGAPVREIADTDHDDGGEDPEEHDRDENLDEREPAVDRSMPVRGVHGLRWSEGWTDGPAV